jgi:hypothetical protein
MAWTAPSGHVWATGETVTAASMNTYIANDLTFVYGDTAWTAPTFANGWVDVVGSYPPAGFRLVGTRVVFRGAMKSGTMSATAFTLPVGYRPTAFARFAVVGSSGAFGEVDVSSAGAVTPSVGSNVQMDLGGIAFDTI